jgi:hypothetical protein
VLTTKTESNIEQGVFEGMEGETLHLDWQYHETVILKVVEGDFPNWRQIENDRVASDATEIALTNFTLGSLSKLCALYPGWTMNWQLSGSLGVIGWKLGPLSGLLMPARMTEPDVDDWIDER